jgi:hypothetical protein
MEKQLEMKNIPWGYELCFNDNCQQQDILQILAKFGPTDDLAFEHYETDFNFA